MIANHIESHVVGLDNDQSYYSYTEIGSRFAPKTALVNIGGLLGQLLLDHDVHGKAGQLKTRATSCKVYQLEPFICKLSRVNLAKQTLSGGLLLLDLANRCIKKVQPSRSR